MENLILEYYNKQDNKNLALIIEIIEVFSQKLTDLPKQIQEDWNETIGYVFYNANEVESEEQVKHVHKWVVQSRTDAIVAV